jgi:hypothetical protein
VSRVFRRLGAVVVVIAAAGEDDFGTLLVLKVSTLLPFMSLLAVGVVAMSLSILLTSSGCEDRRCCRCCGDT